MKLIIIDPVSFDTSWLCLFALYVHILEEK